MSKHILLYTDEPGLAGVGQHNHSILCALAPLGYRVTCVQSQASTPILSYQKELGIQHIWLDFDSLEDWKRSITDTSNAQNIFSQAQPDLIIFSDGWIPANFGAKQIATQLGIPYIVILGIVSPPEAHHWSIKPFVDSLPYFYAQAKKVIAVSNQNLGLLNKFFGVCQSKGQVIYIGRPEKYFTPKNLLIRKRLRHENHIPEDAVLCLTAARYELLKGYQYQLEAIKELKQSSVWSKLYFAWAGSGKLEASLSKAVHELGIADKVKVLGQRWDFPDWLDASDIFVLPSELEGMPLSIMEAMAKGLAVVASAVNGIPEELGETGRLLPDPNIAPQGTVRELVNTLQIWTSNSELRYSIGNAARKRAKQLFREERMIRETIKVIESALLPEKEFDVENKLLKLNQNIKTSPLIANLFATGKIPVIEPVPEGVKRPFWSVMIPTYNCAAYLVETLKSVLNQVPESEEIQIEVVDDCSAQDDMESIVREIGKGRVAFYRQLQNVGATANFNTCIQRAKGQWVHILHSDDKVLPGFYNRLRSALEPELTIGAAFCRYIYMNEEGNWQTLSPLERRTPGILQNWLEQIFVTQLIEYPAIVVRRSVYEKLGGFHSELCHAADWEMWKRIAVHYPIWYEPQPLACYRIHSASDTSRLVKSGANVADIRRAIEISQSYLPATIAAQLSNQARENYALRAFNTAHRMALAGDRVAAIAQVREGVKCSQSPNAIVSALELVQQIVRDSDQYNLLPIDALTLFLSAFQEAFQKQDIALIENLKLKETNLIMFPDWSQPEDLLYQDLASVITSLMNHPDINQITLLIDRGNFAEDEATLFISGVVMNLVMEEGLDIADELEISLVGQLNEMQWEVLLPRINARIILEHENQQAIAQGKVEKVPTYEIPSFGELTSILT